MVSERRCGCCNGRRRGEDRRFLRCPWPQQGVLRRGATECLQEACHGMISNPPPEKKKKKISFPVPLRYFSISVDRNTRKAVAFEGMGGFD